MADRQEGGSRGSSMLAVPGAAESRPINSRRRCASARVKDASSECALLTRVQRSLLRSSWNNLGKNGNEACGAMIMKRLLSAKSGIRKVFGFGIIPMSQLQYDPLFINHARAIAELIDAVVRNLENSELAAIPLQEQGRFHAAFHEYGFKPEYWDDLGEIMAQSVIESEGRSRHREALKAWTLLSSFMVDTMRNAYEREVRSRKRNAQQNGNSPTTPVAVVDCTRRLSALPLEKGREERSSSFG